MLINSPTVPLACSDLNNPIVTIIESCNFVIMGSGVLLVWPQILLEMTSTEVFMLLLGCGFYVVGLIFFALGITHRPIFHTIWHIFVLIAAALHWFLVYFFIIDTDLTSPVKTRVTDFVDQLSAAAHLGFNATASYAASASW
jgi:hypothetical protein